MSACSGHYPQLKRWVQQDGKIVDVVGTKGESIGIKRHFYPEQLGETCNACHRDWDRHTPILVDVIVGFLQAEASDDVETFDFDPYGPEAPEGIDLAVLQSYSFAQYLEGRFD